jgi:amidase
MLNFMAGRSEDDERTWDIPLDPIPDFTKFCKSGSDSLKGITIGVPRNTWDGTSPAPIEESFDAALKMLSSAGAKIVDPADFPDVEGFKKLNNEVKGVVRSSEFKRDIVSYIQTLDSNPNNIHTVEDLIEFTKTDPREEFPDRDVGKFQWTQAEGVDVESEKYKKMVEQEKYFGGPGGILGAMERYDLDVIAFPLDQDVSNDLAAKMGFPAISVPLGFWPEDTPLQLTKTKPELVKVAPGIP